MGLCLGFDTSNYTTSAAVFDGNTAENRGKLLTVPDGTLGLRQSDALFQHTKRLHLMMEQLRADGVMGEICAVGASTRPREVEGSYMPCFLVGEGQGRSLAAALGVPFFACSHQQGHIAAAAWSAGHEELMDKPHLAWHLSGGTTELLYVEPEGNNVRCTRIGGTTDISAGQLIDRTGQMLGLPFPAGKHLDILSREAVNNDVFTVKCPELEFSFSGVQNKVQDYYVKCGNPCETAAYALRCMAKAVCKATENALKQYPNTPVVFSGGVASNSLLRGMTERFDPVFAEPRFSTDNAMGVAILTKRAMEAENGK